MLRPSGIQNENITRMNLGFNPDPVYVVGKLQVNASQWRTERHGEDSIYWWQTNEEVTFLNVSNGCPFSLLQGNAWIHQTKSLGSLSNDDIDDNEIGKKRQQAFCTFLCRHCTSLHDYDVKKPNFTFCGGQELKTTTFFIFSWTSIQSFRMPIPIFDELNHLE